MRRELRRELRCPAGHDSATTDYCDVCGAPMGGSPAAPVGGSPGGSTPPAPAVAPDEMCPACGAARTGRFCEACGHDFAAPAPRAPASRPPAPLASPSPGAQPAEGRWTVTVDADPEYHRTIVAAGEDAASVQLPAYCPRRRFVLDGEQVRIGRRSASRGLHPEIDLSGPPEDPGVSHLHAVLLAQPGGGWAILDPGSTNGTTVNDDPAPIRTNVAVPLAGGDRVHVGAWTTVTLHAPDA